MGLMFRIIIHYLNGETCGMKGRCTHAAEARSPVICSVRPLGHSVLKVKLGEGPMDRGSDISDYFLPWLQVHEVSRRQWRGQRHLSLLL